MSLYAPLNEGNPAVPTLDELRNDGQDSNSVVVTVSSAPSAEQKKIAAAAPPMVVSYAVIAAPPSASVEEHRSQRCLLTACCCGCSLATGTYIISLLELISWVFTFVGAVLAIYIKTQENKIDHAIAKHDAAYPDGDTDAPLDAPTMSTDEKIENTNTIIDIGAMMSPFLIIMSLIGVFFCIKGVNASKGNVDAAKSYMLWKRFTVAWAFVQLLFGAEEGPLGGMISFGVAIYYFLVVRSHYLALTRASADSAAAQSAV